MRFLSYSSRSGALLALLAGCSSMPSPRPQSFEFQIALPADLTAAVCAGAVRVALPFADPTPHVLGAPASQLADGSFEISYEQSADGTWLPNASHRLSVGTPRAGGRAEPTVAVQALSGNLQLPTGPHAIARLHLAIHSTATGTWVSGSLPQCLAADLRPALDRALRLAKDPTSVDLGLSEPNLAALAAHHLLRRAATALRTGQPLVAQALLQQVDRLGVATPRLYEQLGELAAQVGDAALARQLLWQAMVGAADPTSRAHLAERLAAVEATAVARGPLRSAARDCLAEADLAGAETLLHTARRRWPQPAEDYRLQSQVHRQRDDGMAQLACSLLAREYEAEAAGRQPWPNLLPTGFGELARRFHLGIELALASNFAEPLRPLAAAAPWR